MLRSDRSPFDDDGRLAVATNDGEVHVLDPKTGREAKVESGPRRARRVVGPDGTVAVIRLNTVTLRSPTGAA